VAPLDEAAAAVRSVEARLHELLERVRDEQSRMLVRLGEVERALGETAGRIDAPGRRDGGNRHAASRRGLEQAVLREKQEALRAQRAAIGERLSQLHLGAKKLSSVIAQSQMCADYLVGGFGDADDELLSLTQVWALEATEEERRRLAREIHDGPAQVLANAALQLEYCHRLVDRDPDRLRAELDRLRSDLREGLAEVRHFIFDLRPGPLAELGLPATIQRYAENFEERSQVEVELELDYEQTRLSPTKETTVFRIIQEALQNVRKHSRARHVRLGLTGEGDGMIVRIADDGVGFDLGARAESGGRHFGLSSMEERARLIGAELRIASRPGEGTRLELRVPPEGATAQRSRG
jgi:two-component system, NarL family, sensor histidine kinase DegS